MTHETDAEILRRAAATMRERAQAATEGPWVVFDMDEAEHRKDEPLNGPGEGWYWVWAASRLPYYGGVLQPERDHPEAIIGSASINDGDGGQQEQADAEYIASMHPVVGLALADWLDAAYQEWEYSENSLGARSVRAMSGDTNNPDPHALRVARAYLGLEGL